MAPVPQCPSGPYLRFLFGLTKVMSKFSTGTTAIGLVGLTVHNRLLRLSHDSTTVMMAQVTGQKRVR